jgi:hypothetical protein
MVADGGGGTNSDRDGARNRHVHADAHGPSTGTLGTMSRFPWRLGLLFAVGASACGATQSARVTQTSSIPSTSICAPTTTVVGQSVGASACGASQTSPVTYASSARPASVCPPPTTVVSQSAVSTPNERLREGWTTPGYDPGSQALATFRLDPAPPSAAPRRSAREAIALAVHTGNVSVNGPGTRTIARFGLFTGNLVIIGTDANHTLEGARRVKDVSAWLVVTDGAELPVGGPAPPPPGPAGPTPALPPCPSTTHGVQVSVIDDADGTELANLSGGGFAPLS